MSMIFKKSEPKRIAAFTVLIASVLIGMTFIMNDYAFAGDEQIVVDRGVAEDRPVFNPFFVNNPDLDRFFFERDFLGVGGEFEDNPLFNKDNQNALERPEDFRADKQ